MFLQLKKISTILLYRIFYFRRTFCLLRITSRFDDTSFTLLGTITFFYNEILSLCYKLDVEENVSHAAEMK